MKKYISIALFFFSVVFVSSQERNFQIWNQNKVEVKISDRFSISASEKIHYEPKAGDVSLKFGDLSVKRQFADWFEAGVIGRMLWIKNENSWVQEYRPMVFGNLSAEVGYLDFELANRIDYRMYKYLNDHFRYRHMLSVEIPPFYTVTWFKLYMAEEVYFRFDKERFNMARFQTGTKLKYRNFFEMKLFYVYNKSKKSFHWTTTDILGLNLNLEF